MMTRGYLSISVSFWRSVRRWSTMRTTTRRKAMRRWMGTMMVRRASGRMRTTVTRRGM